MSWDCFIETVQLIPTFKIQEYYTTDQPRGSEPKYMKNLKGKRGNVFHQKMLTFLHLC